MATDATGTPTTNYAIPKFNTAVDAPSGVGSNNQMDVIDTTIKTVETTALESAIVFAVVLGS